MPRKNINIVLDEAFMKRFLTRNLKTLFPGAKKITFFYSKYLRFLSEESFLVRYEIDLLMKNGLTITKTLRGNRVKPDTFPIMQFYFNLFGRHGKNVIARPLAYFDRLSFLLYEEYRGLVLREFDHQMDVIMSVVPTIARQLADIHNAPNNLGAIRTVEDEKKYFALLHKKVRHYSSTLGHRFNPLAAKYLRQLSEIQDEKKLVLNHGDFQASNIVYDLRTKNIGFIDFASAVRTSPANDVATFLTHSRAMLCYIFPKAKIDRLEKAFLRHYYARAKKQIAAMVRHDLPVYQGRIALDIITTTAVFTEYNKSPYYMTIINEMFSRAQHNLH